MATDGPTGPLGLGQAAAAFMRLERLAETVGGVFPDGLRTPFPELLDPVSDAGRYFTEMAERADQWASPRMPGVGLPAVEFLLETSADPHAHLDPPEDL